ncbi:MAG: metallophosphoesterase family protein [Ardenticatenaceae bacterium]
MRIALISDIHGYLLPLEAVLADINRKQVDQIICLGDVCVLGPQPREALALVKSLNCPCVMGNHDFDLLHRDLADEPFLWIQKATAWCADRLSEADFEYLRSFQPSLEIPLEADATLLCFHGSPKSNTDLILSTTPDPQLEEMLAGHTATLLAGGHSHVPMVRRHKRTIILNPGSIGLPFEQMPFTGEPTVLPWAEYAIIDWENGTLGIELRRVPIDPEALLQTKLASGMPLPTAI